MLLELGQKPFGFGEGEATAVNTMRECKDKQIREWEGNDDCGRNSRTSARCVGAGNLATVAVGGCDVGAVGGWVAADGFSAGGCAVSGAQL